MKNSFKALCAGVALGFASIVPAQAANFVLVNTDPSGVGFNDTTPATPVGGNPGTTKGEQALNIFTKAAQIWGATLSDSVEIKILASFEPLTPCDASSGVLGSAGAINAFINNASFPQADTYYA